VQEVAIAHKVDLQLPMRHMNDSRLGDFNVADSRFSTTIKDKQV
jgi:hypothetical protein